MDSQSGKRFDVSRILQAECTSTDAWICTDVYTGASLRGCIIWRSFNCRRCGWTMYVVFLKDEGYRRILRSDYMEGSWPSKNDTENYEISEFLKVYKPSARVDEKRVPDRPDYRVIDDVTGERFFVELTAVYLDNRSVPDVHKAALARPAGTLLDISSDNEKLERYKSRILERVREKVRKARKGYDTSLPLVLSVYLAEYLAIFFMRERVDEFLRTNEALFDDVAPFREIVLWGLPNGGFCVIRPSAKGTV